MDLKKLVRLKPNDTLSFKELMSIVKPTNEVEEKILALNLIGVLSGIEASLFESKNGHLIPKPGISLRKVSERCSQSVLRRYSEYGDYICRLLQSIDSYLSNNREHSPTHISYALSARDIINDHVFKQLLPLSISKKFSVNSFSDFLTGEASGFLLDKLKILYEIDSSINSNEESVCEILDVLSEKLYLDSLHDFNLVAQLLLSCLRPTLDYLESILTIGDQRKDDQIFFKLKIDCDPDDFWNMCLSCEKKLPKLFRSSRNLVCMGIRSRLTTLVCNRDGFLNDIKFPKGSLFEHFLSNLRNNLGILPGNSSHIHEHDTPKLQLRLTKYDELFYFDDQNLSIHQLHDEDVIAHEFSKLDLPAPENFLPEDYTSHGIPIEPVIEKSLLLAFKEFIDPISEWLLDRARASYLKNLTVINDFFLLQRANPELKMYLDAIFVDITECFEKTENNLNWQYYNFLDHNIQAFLSQQNLGGKKVTNFVKLDNVHLVYEDLDWISRVIIDNHSKQIYDAAFRFLIQIMYCRWLLENISNLDKTHLRKPRTKRMHQIYLIRYQMLFIINGVYNFIINHLHNYVASLYVTHSGALNYEDLRERFKDFCQKVEAVTMQRPDNNSKIVKSLLKKFCRLADTLWRVWSDMTSQEQLPSRTEIEHFEKGFRIYLFQEEAHDESAFTANY